MKKKLYILDVSGFIFRAYFALPPMTNAKGEPTHALFGFIRSLIKLFKDFNPTHVVAVFDGPDNKRQRQEIYEKYKTNRIGKYADLPDQISKAKIFCDLMGIPHVEVGGVEADDTMGSIALWAKKHNAAVYLCTSDKDLCQLIQDDIYAINPWKDNLIIDEKKVEEIYGIPPKLIVDYLAMTGDASDNIPGLRGFGPKTVAPLLQQFGSLENILNHPEKVSGKKKQETLREEADIAKLSKRLATIHTDIDFPKDEKTFFSLHKPDIIGLKQFYLDMSFHSLVRELDEAIPKTQEVEEVDYQLVDDPAALNNLVTRLLQNKEVCFAIETTDFHPLRAFPVGFGFCIEEKQAFYVPLNGKLGSEYVLTALQPLFSNPDLRFSGHNVKLALHALKNVHIDVANIGFDTILASYILNSASRKHGLDHLILQHFGKIKIATKTLTGTGKKEIGLADVEIAKVSEYCTEHVDYTLRLKHIFEEELKKRKLESLLYELELPLTIVLFQMERHGMYIDPALFERMSKEISKELKILEQEIYDLAGEEFNIGSPKQLAQILFEKMGIKPLKKTATGLSTRAEVLEALAAEHAIAQKLIQYRMLDKLRSTYIDTLPKEIDPKTKRIHPTFNQYIAATGRLACQDPNLQNIPTRTAAGKKIREAFHPQDKNWSYLAGDYSQVELRLLAHLSEDPHLIKAFNHGEDIHASTAALVFDIPLDQVTATQRYQAKAINFGIIYGQQAYGLSQELGIDVHEAAAFIEAYFKRYPRVFKFVAECIEKARESGKSVTMVGREREIPDIHSPNAVLRAAAERLAINTPLQGSAADMIKMAMLDIQSQIIKKKLRSFMVLQIHDELIFEAPDEEIEIVKNLVKSAMEGVFTLKVPVIVDIHIGKNWGEC